MIETFRWFNGMTSDNRHPRLFFFKKDEFKEFQADSEAGWFVVASTSYKKNGKWSGTFFNIEYNSEVCTPRDFDQSERFGPMFRVYRNWNELADRLGCTVETARRFAQQVSPQLLERLDRADQLRKTL